MILLYDIVQVLTASTFDAAETPCIYGSNCAWVRSAFIDVDYSWSSVVSDGLIEKLLGRTFHSPFGQQKINCVTIFVHCPIQVAVLPYCLVHPPTIADTALSFMHVGLND